MKKLLLFFCIATSVISFSQDEKIENQENDNGFDYGIILVKENDEFVESYINNVDPYIVRYVTKNYQDAENLKWIVDEDGTEVTFDLEKKKILLIYDKNDVKLFTRLNYGEDELDKRIAGTAKKKAGKNYKIHLVTEIIYDDQITYEISLESEKDYCFIRITGNKLKGFDRAEITKIISKI